MRLRGSPTPGGGPRDPRTHVTVLDAAGAFSALLLEPESDRSIVDGFTLRGATARALECFAPATLQNLILADNAGAGALLLAGTLRHSEVLRNSGGLLLVNGHCVQPVVVSDVLIADNSRFGVSATDWKCGSRNPLLPGVVLRHVRIVDTSDPAASARGLSLACCPAIRNVEIVGTEGDGVMLYTSGVVGEDLPPAPGTPLEHVTITGSLGAAILVNDSSVSSVTVRGSVLWANAGGDIRGTPGALDVSFTLSESPFPGPGNLAGVDPLLVNAADGSTILSQVASGQPADSPALDAGGRTAAAARLDQRTTRTDGVRDRGDVDLGFHRAPDWFTVMRGVVPTLLAPHIVGVRLPALDPGAALATAPALLFYEVDTDEVIVLRRLAGDVEILLESQGID